MKKQLILGITLSLNLVAFGQIKTPEVEVRSPTSSAINEIQGETSIAGKVTIKSSSVGGAVGVSFDNLILEQNGENVGMTFKSSSSTQAGIAFGDESDHNMGRIFYLHDGDYMSFFTRDQEWLRILDNGNVGLGNTNPQSKLMVNAPNFDLSGKQGVLIGGGSIGLGNYTPAIGFSNSMGGMDAAIAGVQESSDNNAMGLAFFVHPSATSSEPKIEALRISRQGKVGIGTASPQSRLHVKNGTSGAMPASSLDDLVVEHDDHAGISILTPDDKEATISFGDSEKSWVGRIRYEHHSDDMVFFTNNSQRMRINASGNIGVGTSTPKGRLHLFNGSSGATPLSAFDNFIIEQNNNAGLSFLTPNNRNATIAFGDPENAYIGRIRYDHNDNHMAFFINGTERIRVRHIRNSQVTGAQVHENFDNLVIEQFSGNSGISFLSRKNQNAGIAFADNEGQNSGVINYLHNDDAMTFSTNGSERIRILNNGDVGIGTSTPDYDLDIAGDIRYTGMNASSDRRWKKEVKDLTDIENVLNDIHPVAYRWRREEFPDKNFDDELHYGVIAQELEEVLPELVSTDNEGFKSVDYLGMISLLIKGFQERGAEIEDLEAKIESLEAQVQNLLQASEKNQALEVRLAKIEKLLIAGKAEENVEKSAQ